MDLNFGQGNALLGGVSPLEQVFQQYQQGQAGATMQQTPNSAGFNGVVPQQLAEMPPQGGQPPMSGQAPMSAPTMGGAPTGQPPLPSQSSEAQLIIEALGTRLKDDSKLNSDKLKMGLM